MFSNKELELLTTAISCYKRELKDDVLMYKSFEDQSKDTVKRVNELQAEYFDLEALWAKCIKLEQKQSNMVWKDIK